jgi:hypothetical protein
MQSTGKKNKNNFYLLVTIILVISIALNIYQLIRNKKDSVSFQKLITNKELVDKKVKDARDEINRYKGLSAGLDSIIIEANKQIAMKETKINSLLEENTLQELENQKWIEEIASLKEKYLNTIDSLLVQRQINSKLNITIGSLEAKIVTLNKKLGSSEQFPINNLEVSPQKTSPLGNTNQTALAKKASEVQICYQVQSNKATPKGKKVIYIRIFDPNGHFLSEKSPSSGQFLHPDYHMNVPYTITDTIDYQNVVMDVCSKWKNPENYISGIYLVELYTDKESIGTTTFTLR